MEKFDLIHVLNSSDHMEQGWPIWWAIKDNNIIITRGKTGTRTLLEFCDYSCVDTNITFREIEDLIINKGYCLHFVIRDPFDRFRSGLLEDWFINVWPMIKDLNIEEKIDWDTVVDRYVKYRLSIISDSTIRSQFHTGNWLKDVETLVRYFNKYNYKVWNFDNLYKMKKSLGKDLDIKNNDSNTKGYFRILFIKAFNNLSLETKDLIYQYLDCDIKAYNKLFGEHQYE